MQLPEIGKTKLPLGRALGNFAAQGRDCLRVSVCRARVTALAVSVFGGTTALPGAQDVNSVGRSMSSDQIY